MSAFYDRKLHIFKKYMQPNMKTNPEPNMNKMIFINNAIESGWTVRKKGDSYVFTKKHENRREVFMENYLEKFISTNIVNSVSLSSKI